MAFAVLGFSGYMLFTGVIWPWGWGLGAILLLASFPRSMGRPKPRRDMPPSATESNELPPLHAADSMNPYASPRSEPLRRQPLPLSAWPWLAGFGFVAVGLLSALVGLVAFVIYVVHSVGSFGQ
jgi:hypothetical protein